jgi:hypothetical protein
LTSNACTACLSCAVVKITDGRLRQLQHVAGELEPAHLRHLDVGETRSALTACKSSSAFAARWPASPDAGERQRSRAIVEKLGAAGAAPEASSSTISTRSGESATRASRSRSPRRSSSRPSGSHALSGGVGRFARSARAARRAFAGARGRHPDVHS